MVNTVKRDAERFEDNPYAEAYSRPRIVGTDARLFAASLRTAAAGFAPCGRGRRKARPKRRD